MIYRVDRRSHGGSHDTADQMKLLACHVIAGLDAEHGGPSYSVPRLCHALVNAGIGVELLSVQVGESAAGEERTYADLRFGASYSRFPVLKHMRHSSALGAALCSATSRADIVHNHGLWLMPNVAAGRAAARAGKPLVVSPRGMLAPEALEFSRIKKRVFWALLQGSATRSAACLHATSEQELEEIRAFGLRQPIAIIANGIDVSSDDAPQQARLMIKRNVLSLGRIHPKKALDRLLHAWARIESAHPDWCLRIAGPAEGAHDEALRALIKCLGLSRVSIEGPAYGDAKLAAYRNADLFVLPSLNENFGLTVAEALAAGTPVISTKGAPWAGLETEGCGWWIDHGAEPLAAALDRAMTMSRSTLAAMGAKGRAWMDRDFTWERVARDMVDVYRWLCGGAPVPNTVRLD